MKYYLLKDREVVDVKDVREWAKEWAKPTENDIGKTDIVLNEIEYNVSTVFLGFEHGFSDGKPLVFETMIFSPEDKTLDEYQDRYTTYNDALIGHMKAIDLIIKSDPLKHGFKLLWKTGGKDTGIAKELGFKKDKG